MAVSQSASMDGLTDPLTEREQEILACLVEGLTNQEIADRLFLSITTIRWYNSQIYSKLGVSNRKDAVEQATALGLFAAPDVEGLPVPARHNLPAQTTAFIGRQQELTDLAGLLAQDDVRLLTILAPGGMGKTRLALAVAEGQLRYHPDGVFFVPLAPLSSPDDLVTAIAEHVDFSFYGSDPPVQQLRDYFRERKMLLVLDNFEHLLDGAPLVTDVLHAAPQVKVLATSREKLNLSGETIFALSGLQFPTWETPEDALAYDAVKLFMQSAQRVRPDFELHAEDLDYLARICRLTTGMPLGIVLAAGWVDVLSLEQIATELQQDIDILETELRDVPERQRSVRASFNYTWSRLDKAERNVFMKLSVFRGGFTAEAVQAVTGANTRHLRKLVDKALVQILPGGRYDVHELLRQYGEDQLGNASDIAAIQGLHTDYFLNFLADLDANLESDDAETRFLFRLDLDNIRLAWLRAVQSHQYERLDETIENLFVVFPKDSFMWEIDDLFQYTVAQLASDDDTAPHPVWDKAVVIGEWLRSEVSPDPINLQLVEAALARARLRQDRRQTAWGLQVLAKHYRFIEEYDTCLQYYQEALDVWRELDDPYRMTNVLIDTANVYLMVGQPAQGLKCYEEGAAIRHRLGHWTGLANFYGAFAWFHLIYGKLSEAEQYLDRVMTIQRAHGMPSTWGRILYLRALLLLLRGEMVGAETVAAVIQKAARESRMAVDRDHALSMTDLLVSLKGNPATLLNYGRGETLHFGGIFTHWSSAVVNCCLGDDEQFSLDFHVTLNDALQIKSPTLKFVSLPLAAIFVSRQGKPKRAVELLGLAHTAPEALLGWLAVWQLLAEVQVELKVELCDQEYAAAWDRGAALDLDTVIAELLAEIAP